jgi:hypothetical protein
MAANNTDEQQKIERQEAQEIYDWLVSRCKRPDGGIDGYTSISMFVRAVRAIKLPGTSMLKTAQQMYFVTEASLRQRGPPLNEDADSLWEMAHCLRQAHAAFCEVDLR